MLYSFDKARFTRRIVKHHDDTIKGVAYLISHYLKTSSVRRILEAAQVYDPTASVSTGGLMNDTSAIYADGYHVRFRRFDEHFLDTPIYCLVPFGSEPEHLAEYARELVRRSPERDLRDYWDQMRWNLSAVVSSLATVQGLWKDLEEEQWRMVGVKPEDIDTEYDAFAKEALKGVA